jgi:hypothetical protein
MGIMSDFKKGDVVRVTREGLHPFKAGTEVTILSGPNAVDIYWVRGPKQDTVIHSSELYKPKATEDE